MRFDPHRPQPYLFSLARAAAFEFASAGVGCRRRWIATATRVCRLPASINQSRKRLVNLSFFAFFPREREAEVMAESAAVTPQAARPAPEGTVLREPGRKPTERPLTPQPALAARRIHAPRPSSCSGEKLGDAPALKTPLAERFVLLRPSHQAVLFL